MKYVTTIFLVVCTTTMLYARDNSGNKLVLRAAPVLAPSWSWVDASSGGGESEVDASGFGFGLDVSLGKKLNKNLMAGGQLTYLMTKDPDLNVNGTEYSDVDILLTNVRLGPFLRYYLGESFYLSGSFGFASFWSSGDDDTMDPAAYGVAFSLGIGYDYWFSSKVGLSIFADITASYTWASDSGIDYFVQSLYAPAFGFGVNFKL